MKIKKQKDLNNSEKENKIVSAYLKKPSLILKISIIYFTLTIINIFIFWLAVGSFQMDLISKKAIRDGETTAYNILYRIQELTNKKSWKNEFYKNPDKAIHKFETKLKLFSESKFLLLKNFAILSSNGKIIYNYQNKISKDSLSPNLFRKTLKAVHLRELKNQAFYCFPNILNYNIEIFIPVLHKELEDYIFYTKIPMLSIQKELQHLQILALTMILTLLLFQFLAGYFLYKLIIHPVQELVSGVNQISKGDFDIILSEDVKTRELGQLTYQFNKMAVSLNDKSEKLKLAISDLKYKDKLVQIELGLAQNIQEGIMPQSVSSPLITMVVHYLPLEKISGDYYDVFTHDDGSTSLLLADVSGHGIPAALITIMAKFLFTTEIKKEKDPAKLFTKVNKKLSKQIEAVDDYLTAFYIHIHPDLKMDYCNAGHPKPILYRSKTATIELLDSQGIYIGLFEEPHIDYCNASCQLQAKDRIVFYTDGLTEASNSQREAFNNDRLLNCVLKYANLPLEDFKHKIMETLNNFVQGENSTDDLTLLIIEIK